MHVLSYPVKRHGPDCHSSRVRTCDFIAMPRMIALLCCSQFLTFTDPVSLLPNGSNNLHYRRSSRCIRRWPTHNQSAPPLTPGLSVRHLRQPKRPADQFDCRGGRADPGDPQYPNPPLPRSSLDGSRRFAALLPHVLHSPALISTSTSTSTHPSSFPQVGAYGALVGWS